MRTAEDVRKLHQALVEFCLTNGRDHALKSPVEQQADDLAAILLMKLEMLARQMRLECGQSVCSPVQAPSQDEELSSLLADLALMAQGGALRKALGAGGAGALRDTLAEVRSAGDANLAEALDSIDRGNFLRARGESRGRMAILAEKQDLLNGKLGK